MRAVIVARVVSAVEARSAGAVDVVAADDFAAADGLIRSGGVGLVVSPVTLGSNSGTGLELARMCRPRGIPCVLVDRHADTAGDMFGAACMVPGGDLAAAVRRAVKMRRA